MLYPTISELTKDEFNRYELALAEKSATGNKEADRNLINMINKEYRDEKAVKNAITRISSGEYQIVRVEESEEIEEQTEEVEATEETATEDAE